MVKKYAIIGLGGRSSFYYTTLARGFKATSSIVGLCDTDRTRMNVANDQLISLDYPSAPIPTYKAHDFDKMIAETKPDEVIITTMNRTPWYIYYQSLRAGV